MSQFTVYDARLGTSGGNPLYLRQVTNASVSENLRVLMGRMSGGKYASDQFIESGDPAAEITTTDIGGFLTGFGTEGTRITDGTTVIVPWRTRSSGGTHASGSTHSHVRGTGSACPVQLVPQSISAPRQGAVTAQGMIAFLSDDGVTKPHRVYNGDQALASQAFTAMWGLGPIYVNGSERPLNVGYTVNFGVQLSEMKRYAGAIYPTDCFIETVNPSFEFTEEDFATLYGFTGGAAITGLSAFLRKRLSGGGYEDDASTVHINFTLGGGIATPRPLSAQDTKEGTASILIEATGALTTYNGVAIAAP